MSRITVGMLDDHIISKAQITPTTKTDGLVLYVKEIEEGKNFAVALDGSSDLKVIIGLEKDATPSASTAIKFNWLIINQQ